MKNNFKKFIIILLVLFVLSGMFFSLKRAMAQEEKKEIPMEIDYPKSLGNDPGKSIPDYVRYIYQFSAGLAAFLAVMMVALGGIKLMTSSGDPNRMNDAKDQILKALMGLGLVLGSFALISIINPDLILLREPFVEDTKEEEWDVGQKAEDYGLKNEALGKDTAELSANASVVTYDPTDNKDYVKYCSSLSAFSQEDTEDKGQLGCYLMTLEELSVELKADFPDKDEVYAVFYNPQNMEPVKELLKKVYGKKGDEDSCLFDKRAELFNCFDAYKINNNVDNCDDDNAYKIYCIKSYE